MSAIGKIFVSHSSKDEEIVDEFVDLLVSTTNLTHDNIFCSSLDGMGIPIGKDAINTIKRELDNCNIVVALISFG